jgi:hypothetical protein
MTRHFIDVHWNRETTSTLSPRDSWRNHNEGANAFYLAKDEKTLWCFTVLFLTYKYGRRIVSLGRCVSENKPQQEDKMKFYVILCNFVYYNEGTIFYKHLLLVNNHRING